MTNEELRESLERKTYADVKESGKRIFYTLTDIRDGKPISVADASQPTNLWNASRRHAIFLSLLCEKLEAKGILSKAEIESLLIDTVHGPGTSAAVASR
jgi:hypothetical protein